MLVESCVVETLLEISCDPFTLLGTQGQQLLAQVPSNML